MFHYRYIFLMANIIDETIGITINIVAQGMAHAFNVNYSSYVEPNTDFPINYDVENTGAADTLWGELYEIIPGAPATPVPGTYWEDTFTAGEIKSKMITLPGITEPFVGELRVGHVY